MQEWKKCLTWLSPYCFLCYLQQNIILILQLVPSRLLQMPVLFFFFNAIIFIESFFSKRKGHMYTCGWFMLMYGRNQHNIVEQISCNEKFKKESYLWKYLLYIKFKEVQSSKKGNAKECLNYRIRLWNLINSNMLTHQKKSFILYSFLELLFVC